MTMNEVTQAGVKKVAAVAIDASGNVVPAMSPWIDGSPLGNAGGPQLRANISYNLAGAAGGLYAVTTKEQDLVIDPVYDVRYLRIENLSSVAMTVTFNALNAATAATIVNTTMPGTIGGYVPYERVNGSSTKEFHFLSPVTKVSYSYATGTTNAFFIEGR